MAQVAAGLADASLASGQGAVRIMLFVGGPTTEGGGQVVGKELSEPIRSHKVPPTARPPFPLPPPPPPPPKKNSPFDIDEGMPPTGRWPVGFRIPLTNESISRKYTTGRSTSCQVADLLCFSALIRPWIQSQDLVKETAAHYKKARKFFDGLAAQLVRQGHALDVFACSLDQVRALACTHLSSATDRFCATIICGQPGCSPPDFYWSAGTSRGISQRLFPGGLPNICPRPGPSCLTLSIW